MGVKTQAALVSGFCYISLCTA